MLLDQLLDEYTDAEVAEQLNQRGWRTYEGKLFHATRVLSLRRYNHLKDHGARLRDRGFLSATEAAQAYGVSPETIRNWGRAGCIPMYHADGRGIMFTSVGMNLIMGEAGGATDMHPLPFACHIQTGFILMKDLRLDQSGFDLLLDLCQALGAPPDQLAESPFAQRHSQQVFHHFTGSRQGEQLLLHQIDAGRPNHRAILHWGTDLVGKGGDRHLLARRTLFVLGPVLAHQQARQGHVDHLPTFNRTGGNVSQIVLAVLTALHRMHHHRVRARGKRQGRARMSFLSPRLLPTFLAQALGLAHEPIGGWRQVAIAAVFGQPLFQGVETLLQLGDQFILFRQLFLLHCYLFPLAPIFGTKLDEFLFCCHDPTLHGFRLLHKSVGDLSSY